MWDPNFILLTWLLLWTWTIFILELLILITLVSILIDFLHDFCFSLHSHVLPLLITRRNWILKVTTFLFQAIKNLHFFFPIHFILIFILYWLIYSWLEEFFILKILSLKRLRHHSSIVIYMRFFKLFSTFLIFLLEIITLLLIFLDHIYCLCYFLLLLLNHFIFNFLCFLNLIGFSFYPLFFFTCFNWLLLLNINLLRFLILRSSMLFFLVLLLHFSLTHLGHFLWFNVSIQDIENEKLFRFFWFFQFQEKLIRNEGKKVASILALKKK